MASIQEHLDKIKNAIFGKDVRQAIHDSIEECYRTASVDHDNANMEVKRARGTHETLNDRLVENEKKQENFSSQLDTKANDFEVRKKVESIKLEDLHTEVKSAMTGGSVAVVGLNSVGEENVKTNSITNSKLEIRTESVLNEFCKDLKLIELTPNIFEFEYGLITSDGEFSSEEIKATALNNIRTKNIHKIKKLRVDLLVDNVMLKVVYYDNFNNFIKASKWMSKTPTNWSDGGVSNFEVENSNVVLCFADTTVNNTESFTITIEEMTSRFTLTETVGVVIDGGIIDNTHIKPKTLDLTIFKEEVLNDISKDGTTILDGVMKLPNEFGIIPFEIVKENNRYNISLSSKQLNINPVTVYVSDSSTSEGLGLDKSQPITLKQVKQNFINNLYSSKNIRIKFIDNIYFMDSKSDFDLIGTGQDSTVTNLTLESENFTWIGYGKKNVLWGNYSENTNLYVTTSSIKVSDLADIENLKNDGMPNLYVKKNSLANVTKEGDFCQVGEKVYVYPHSTNDINKINLIYGFDYSTDKTIPGIITVRKNSKGNIIFKNIGTFLDCLNLRDLKSLDVWYYFFNCRFHRDSMDSLALDGKYKAVLVDCIADYASKDNFNYHSTSKDSVAIELNCKSYGAGQHKLDTNGVNTTKDSCNGSTAHNGMCVARFGCSYWDCEGSVVADVNNCVTYCVDCSVKNILPTISNANYKASYMLHDNRFSSIIYRPNDSHKNYLINCVGGGENITWGVRSEGMKIDIANFKGNTTHYQEGTSDINNIQTII